MKKLSGFLFLLVMVFGIAVLTANASLIDQGDGTLRDGNLLWYQDLSDFTGATYGQQVTAINMSSLAGGGWTMATASEMEQLRANNTNAQIQASFLPARAGKGDLEVCKVKGRSLFLAEKL